MILQVGLQAPGQTLWVGLNPDLQHDNPDFQVNLNLKWSLVTDINVCGDKPALTSFGAAVKVRTSSLLH
jgi:hypothetical protein